MSLAQLPEEVRASTRCLLWRYEQRAGRWTKVPYIATRPDIRAAVDDPTTWCPFAVAVAAVQAGHGAGVGFVLGDGRVGVDLDHVRDARSGAVAPDALGMIELLCSYTEVSPSGTGLHVLAHGTLPPGGRHRGQIEMYDGGRFFTLTGHHVSGTPWTLEERTAELAVLHTRWFGVSHPPPRGMSRARIDIGDDAALLARARSARNGPKFAALYAGDASGYPSPSEADLALCNLLAFWTHGDAARMDALFRSGGLMRAKWDERRGTETYGERTIATAIATTARRT